jgi:hypothetical protein
VDAELTVIVLDDIETVNPFGADAVTAKLEDAQPTSLLKTPIAYESCCPGIPHDPGDAHAQVLSIEARGAFWVHPDVEGPPDAVVLPRPEAHAAGPAMASIVAIARKVINRRAVPTLVPPSASAVLSEPLASAHAGCT